MTFRCPQGRRRLARPASTALFYQMSFRCLAIVFVTGPSEPKWSSGSRRTCTRQGGEHLCPHNSLLQGVRDLAANQVTTSKFGRLIRVLMHGALSCLLFYQSSPALPKVRWLTDCCRLFSLSTHTLFRISHNNAQTHQ